jgi:hypothetical protein
VVGVDLVDFSQDYPGFKFVQADLLTWDGWRDYPFRLVVASPPCQEYSRHGMPWLKKKQPPVPSKELWRRCVWIAERLGVPLVLENVRSARMFHGPAKNNCGPYYLWGSGVPAILPGRCVPKFGKRGWDKRTRTALAAQIPEVLSRWVARCAAREVTP